MKTCIALVFVALVACVVAERCGDNGDCREHGITSCGSGYDVVCNRERQCECLQSGGFGSCTLQSDCTNRCDNGRDPHCVDGHCRCGRI